MELEESPEILYDKSPDVSPSLGVHSQEKCCGIRVFYFSKSKNESNCDHHDEHDENWRARMAAGDCLEAGTVVGLPCYSGRRGRAVTHSVAILWDCGVDRVYTESQLGNIRVFDLGPAGYKGEMVFCDKCLIPVMGFAWRLAKEKDSTGDLYDLCCVHYNENEDPHSRNHFYCNIPTGYIPSGESESVHVRSRSRPKINPRSGGDSKEYKLIGLFKNAEVKDSNNEFKDGRVIKIEHLDKSVKDDSPEVMAQQDMRKADYYNCCAEIHIPGKPLMYRSAGAQGRIDVEVTSPGTWGTIFAAHHPPLSFELLYEMTACRDHCLPLGDGNSCFMRRQKDGKCNSLTISGTTLEKIPEKVWNECRDLKIVILYMNRLSELPEELSSFRNTITLVCIQNNCFREIPACLYEFKHLEHLNMHGNYLSVVPEDFQAFHNLQRLYLGDNDLISLPDIFDHFPLLEKASFKMNKLTRLPPSFARLEKLENLDISDNSIVILPQPILNLKSLKFLNIERNRIQRLTPADADDQKLYTLTYYFFCQLSHLQLKGNPIQQHQQLKYVAHHEILKRVKDSDIFRELSLIDLTRSLRVNVLGVSGAGKTSVVQALVLEKYVIPTTQKGHRHTVGIDRYHLPVDIKGKTILLHIWDHAGDDEYAMMNDLFISDQSLVWIVVNLSKYEPSGERQDQKVFCEHIGQWLLQVMSHNLKPIVWIICTHTDVSFQTKMKINHIRNWANKLCQGFHASLDKAEKKHSEMLRACCKQTEEVEETLRLETVLWKADVPQFMINNLKIVEVSNTYGFEGLDNVQRHLEDLFLSSSWASSLFKSPLPIEWQKAMDLLQLHAEEEVNHLTTYNVPAISTEEVQGISALADEESAKSFREYQHNVGEVYLIQSSGDSKEDSGKSVAVLNIDWLISLLKEVYRHDFNSRLDSAKYSMEFSSVRDEAFALAKQMRENKGLIPEFILKPLWKCDESDKDYLFKSIVALFKNFNLTYPSQGPDPAYFFPYLRKSKIPEKYHHGFFPRPGDQRPAKLSILSLKYVFKFFFPRFFVQRLGLQVNSCHNPTNKGTEIYDNGFLAELGNGDHLAITQPVVNRPNQEEIRIYLHSMSTENPDLWSRVSEVFQSIHSVLNYWKFYGDSEVSVVCPECILSGEDSPNSLQLMQFSDDTCYDHIQRLKVLLCEICNKTVPIVDVVPSRSHDLSKSHQMFEIECVATEDEFTSKLSRSKFTLNTQSLLLSHDSTTSSDTSLWPVLGGAQLLYFNTTSLRSEFSSAESYNTSESNFAMDPHQEQGMN